MSKKYNVNVVNEIHKRTNEKIKITTITKKNEKAIKIDDILMVAESMMKQNPKKKLMIKAISNAGYIQLKGYDQSLNAIEDDDNYFGREVVGERHISIFKVSYYLI